MRITNVSRALLSYSNFAFVSLKIKETAYSFRCLLISLLCLEFFTFEHASSVIRGRIIVTFPKYLNS